MKETKLDEAKRGVIRRAFWSYKNYCLSSDPETREKGVFGRDYGDGSCCNPEDCAVFVRTSCKKISESLFLIDENITLVMEGMDKAREYLEKTDASKGKEPV